MNKSSLPFLFKIENTLGPLENEIMQALWSKDKVTVRDILLRLRKRKSVAYTTVMTVMDNLYKKGFLVREKVKKSYYYSPVAKENYVVTISLSRVFKDLIEDYGKIKVLYSVFATSVLPKINIAIITPTSNKVIKTYRTPVGYGASFTLLLFLFGLSAYDLLQNFSFFATFDYFSLLTSDFNFSIDRLRLAVLALLESLPTINILTTAVSLIFVIILAKKLSRLLNFRAPTFTSLGGVI